MKDHLFSTIFLLSIIVSSPFLPSSLNAQGNDTEELTLEQLYDIYSENYEALIYKTQYQGPSWVNRKLHFLAPDIHTILDLGCADGYIGRLLLCYNPKYQISGIDFSNGMIQACQAKGGYIELLQEDLNKGLPKSIQSKTYDMILALGCLEFIKNHNDLFQQVHSLLTPKGLFWLTVQADTVEDTDNEVITVYSKEEIKKILKENDFKILDIEFQNAGYIRSFDKKPVPYFFIIAEAI